MMGLKFFATQRGAIKWLEMTKASGFVRKKWTAIVMESQLQEWAEEIEVFELFLWVMATWLRPHVVQSVNSTMAMHSTTKANVRIIPHPLSSHLQTPENTEVADLEEREWMIAITTDQMIDVQRLGAMSINALIVTATAAIDATVETVDIANAHLMPQKAMIVVSIRTAKRAERRKRKAVRGAVGITRSVIALVAAIGMTRVGDPTRVVAVGGIHVAHLLLPPPHLAPRPTRRRPRRRPRLIRESIVAVIVDRAIVTIAIRTIGHVNADIGIEKTMKVTTKMKKTDIVITNTQLETVKTTAIVIVIDRHRCRLRQSSGLRELLHRCTRRRRRRTYDTSTFVNMTNTPWKLKRPLLLRRRLLRPLSPPVSMTTTVTTTITSKTKTWSVPALRQSK